MSKITIKGWDAKARTMLRYIKPGDIFAFAQHGGGYRFGRIMTKISIGHVAEIFAYTAPEPVIPVDEIDVAKRVWGPACIDAHSLFDRKLEGEWRIIGHQEGYEPEKFEGVYFAYGAPGSYKRVDIFDDLTSIGPEDAGRWPAYTPYGDDQVQEQLAERETR